MPRRRKRVAEQKTKKGKDLLPCTPAPSPCPDPLCSAPLTLLAAPSTRPCLLQSSAPASAPAYAPAQAAHQLCTFLFAPLHLKSPLPLRPCTSLSPLHQPRALHRPCVTPPAAPLSLQPTEHHVLALLAG
ncbi:hypothetical protein SLEP1_g26209 [Rubroshorea leprosula]|uniref:Uncharacterized protein n=1 Tax=Rubroshorea leprosula TaxID=152421 RepID=A0AAV5JYS0_9ROSI|nr:hypothetical protein SLEP1_g26209 [Rubroshorea leprosula]